MKLLGKINYDVGDSSDYKINKYKLRKALEEAGFGIVEEYDWKDMVVEK